MISPDMEVQWMNVKLGKVTTGPAIDLFREYTHHMMKVKEDCKEILFNPGELKITDWRGWTDVKYIRKVEYQVPIWIKIFLNNQFVRVSGGEKIPVYTSTTPKKGFHGASVFSYELKAPCEFKHLVDFIRVRRALDQDGNPSEFIHPTVMVDDMYNSDFGYEIGTRSKFFNCNNVHIFGSDDIPERMEVSR